MAVKYYRDFSGGFSNNSDQTNLPDNVLADVENLIWEGKLRKKYGYRVDATITLANATAVAGIIHNYLYETGYILAVSTTTNVTFLAWDADTGFTTIGSKTFTIHPVYFAYLNGYIVATNGYDKPLAIWYSSATYYSNDLEQVDARTRDNADWKAGQYVASGPTYTDDTTDAQDAGADDFAISTVTNNDGFWIACFYLFTKVVLTSASQMTGSPVAVYEYYKGSGVWGNLTLTTTPSWTAAAGDRTLEFDCPSDWVVYDDDTETNLANRFVIRIRYTTATSADTVDSIALSFTRSVSWALQNQIGWQIVSHGGRLWIAAGEIVAYSNYNSALGWEPYFIEYFQGGTKKIYNMVSHQNALYIFKNAVIYKYSGTSFDNYIKSKIADIGTTYYTTAVSCGNYLMFGNALGEYIISDDSVIDVTQHLKDRAASVNIGAAPLTYFKNRVYAFDGGATGLVYDFTKIIEIGGENCIPCFDLLDSTDTYKRTAVRYDESNVYLVGWGLGLQLRTYDIDGPDNRPTYSNLVTGATAYKTLIKTKLLDFTISSTRKAIPRIKVEALDGTDLSVVFRDDVDTVITSGTMSAKLDFDGLTDAITNGGLEAVITSGWNNTVGTTTGTSRDTTTKRTGTGSFKIAPTGTLCGRGNSTWVDTVNPMSYYITGYYKMTSWTSGSVVIDVGSALTHTTSFIYANLATITAATSDWVKFEKAVSVKYGAYLKIYAPAGSTNVCYIDDITVYPLTKFVTYEFTPPYQVDGKNFALELSQTSLAETSIKSIGIEYSPRRF